jgi:hypothetical protein
MIKQYVYNEGEWQRKLFKTMMDCFGVRIT